MKKIITLASLGLLLIFPAYSFAEDPTSVPPTSAPANTSVPPTSIPPTSVPVNTNVPPTSIPPTSAPANTNVPAPTSQNNPTAVPTKATNVVKIIKTIPPTLDPEEKKLLEVTPEEETASSTTSIANQVEISPTPSPENTNKSFKTIGFIFTIITILGGAFAYDKYQKTGQLFPRKSRPIIFAPSKNIFDKNPEIQNEERRFENPNRFTNMDNTPSTNIEVEESEILPFQKPKGLRKF